jgi:hypothetical protein
MPNPVPVGTWHVWLKCQAYNGAGVFNKQYTLGFPSGNVVRIADDRDGNTHWTDFGTVTLSTPLTNVPVTMQTTDGAIKGSMSVIGITFTSQISAIMTGDDYLQVWTGAGPEDTNAPVAGNYIKNSSFENGITEFSFSENTEKWFDSSDIWSDKEAHTGTHSYRINAKNCADNRFSATLRSRPYLVRKDKRHSARVWVKIPTGSGGIVSLSMIPIVLVPTGSGLSPLAAITTGNITVTGNTWFEVKLENKLLPAYPAPAAYAIEFDLENPTPPTSILDCYVDDFQFSEGATIPAFAPAYPVEIQISNTKVGGQYFIENNDTVLDFYVTTQNTTPDTIGVSYQIWDNKLEVIQSGGVSVPTTGAGTFKSTLTLNSLGLGPFRIRGEESGGSVTEMYFSRMHTPRNVAPEQSRIGAHIESFWYSGQLASGSKWTRLLSPNALLRWELVEPTQGVWKYSEPQVYRTATMKMPLGILDSSRPTWAKRHYVKTSSVTGTFLIGETVNQSPSGASGVVATVFTDSDVCKSGLQLKNVTGTFTKTNTITGVTSGATANQLSIVVIDTPDMGGYANYVTNIVTKWKDIIKYWEIDNEPDKDAGLPAFSSTWDKAGTITNYTFYGQMSKIATDIVPSICPDCKIIGVAGVADEGSLKYVWESMDLATRTKLYAASMHFYDLNGEVTGVNFPSVTRAESSRLWLSGLETPIAGGRVWNSESGASTFSAYLGSYANWRNYGEAVLEFRDSEDQIRAWTSAPSRTAINLINSLGSGFQRHFNYDSRWFRRYSDPVNGFKGGVNTDIDLMECLQPHGTAYRNAAWFLDSPTLIVSGVRPTPVTTHTRGYGFKFAGPGNWDLFTIHVIGPAGWRKMTWTLNASQYEVYDMYGNLVPQSGNTIQYGPLVQIIKGTSVTMETMAAAFQAATFVSEPDTTPPNLVIFDYPPGAGPNLLEKHLIRFRWGAWDNVDFLIKENIFGTSFRWKMVGATDPSFTPWTNKSFVDLSPTFLGGGGIKTFTVEAKDKAGNTDSQSVNFNWSP